MQFKQTLDLVWQRGRGKHVLLLLNLHPGLYQLLMGKDKRFLLGLLIQGLNLQSKQATVVEATWDYIHVQKSEVMQCND